MDRSSIIRRATEIGLSQTDLASKLDYTRDGLYKAIVRETIPVVKYKLMCELLNVPFGTFIINDSEQDFVADEKRVWKLIHALEVVIKKYKSV